MGEDNGDLETTLAFDIHKVGLWCLDELLELVSRLLNRCWWITEVVGGHWYLVNPVGEGKCGVDCGGVVKKCAVGSL